MRVWSFRSSNDVDNHRIAYTKTFSQVYLRDMTLFLSHSKRKVIEYVTIIEKKCNSRLMSQEGMVDFHDQHKINDNLGIHRIWVISE